MKKTRKHLAVFFGAGQIFTAPTIEMVEGSSFEAKPWL